MWRERVGTGGMRKNAYQTVPQTHYVNSVKTWILQKGPRFPTWARSNFGPLSLQLPKMAGSPPWRHTCSISWQADINNKACNAACECHKGFQQVWHSPVRFHFVQQKEGLCHWLASESFAWSFFYGPSCPESTIFTRRHDNRPIRDVGIGGVSGGVGGDVWVNTFRGTPRGERLCDTL